MIEAVKAIGEALPLVAFFVVAGWVSVTLLREMARVDIARIEANQRKDDDDHA